MDRLITPLIALTIFLAIIVSGCAPAPLLPAVTPAPAAALLPTWTPTATASPTATATSSPTATLSPTPTLTPTTTAAATATVSPTALPTPTATATPSPIPTPVPAPAAADWPHLVWQLINQERAQQGLAPLAYNDKLALAAQRHAEDCAQRGYGGHVGSDGTKLRERLKRVGYTPKWVNESWAWTHTPRQAVFMWLDETPPNDPHRRMLLSPKLKEVGVGVAASNSGYYFIADFGR